MSIYREANSGAKEGRRGLLARSNSKKSSKKLQNRLVGTFVINWCKSKNKLWLYALNDQGFLVKNFFASRFRHVHLMFRSLFIVELDEEFCQLKHSCIQYETQILTKKEKKIS